MLPALLHTLAFFLCLNVQTMNTPLAGAWLFFHVAGCGLLLYNGKYEKTKSLTRKLCIAWMLALGASTFLINPTNGAAVTMWILLAMPSLAVCLRKEHLRAYLLGFGGVITLYALGIIAQTLLSVGYTTYNTGYYTWPLLDPNNAAAVLNIAFLPALWMLFTRGEHWLEPCVVLGIALILTGSKAGICAAGIVTFFMLCRLHGKKVFLTGLLALPAMLVSVFFLHPEWIVRFADSFSDRFPIWTVSWRLLMDHPLRGFGLGQFGYYYQQVRTEHYTAGYFAHNDFLQLAVELGIPCTLVFVGLLAAAVKETTQTNFPATMVLVAVSLQAFMEFQFYAPAVVYPLGLVLAYHLHGKPAENSLYRRLG